mmetsp:Transcript_151328/g.267082  ORF Transcript_151328/g.267082 Transcript_151328/m.267082 type:complete len:629 (+) Transcript_151328:83-1969(+)
MLDELGDSITPFATSKGGMEVVEVVDSNGRDLDDDMVVINACGRTVNANFNAIPTVPALQEMLQRELSIKGQSFDLFDDHGVSLITDGDLRYAVKRGRMPLIANLCEASIHSIEIRREELAQMQWKLLRDQVSGLAEKILSVGHRVQELSEAINGLKKEREADVDRAKNQLNALVDSAKDAAQQSFMQIAERVDAVAHSVAIERNNREATKQGTENMIQSLRDQITADRSTRRSEQAAMSSQVDEVQKTILQELKARESFEARHRNDINWLSDRIEALSATQVEKHQDLSDQWKTHMGQAQTQEQDYARQVVQVQTDAESAKIESLSRFKRLEDRAATIEQRLAEIAGREANHFDELQSKHHKIRTSLEQLRLEDRGRGLEMRRRAALNNGLEDLQEEKDASSSDIMASTSTQGLRLETSSPASFSAEVNTRRSLGGGAASSLPLQSRSPSPPMPMRMENVPAAYPNVAPGTPMVSPGSSVQGSQMNSPMLRTGGLSPAADARIRGSLSPVTNGTRAGALSPMTAVRPFAGPSPVQPMRGGAASPMNGLRSGSIGPSTQMGRAGSVSPMGVRSQSPVQVRSVTTSVFPFGNVPAAPGPVAQPGTAPAGSVNLPTGLPSAIPLKPGPPQ